MSKRRAFNGFLGSALMFGLILSIAVPSYAEGRPGMGGGHGKGVGHGRGEAPRASEGATPPGLAKKGNMPHGLEKQGKTPAGWAKGEKKGWEKARSAGAEKGRKEERQPGHNPIMHSR